jgi:asparagine synthase (glutamine-hydrolysing)
MCGLAGVLFGSRLSAEGTARWLDLASRMERSIAHRGPDDSGIHASADGRCILASRRLAIQDLSSDGRMPLTNEDATVWTSFNGEIYNFAVLREELRALGHVFRSQSDTEVIVHGYESWGLDFLRRLEGMFAIAIYDERAGCLVLARDRFGEKPLYLAHTPEGHLAFASEAKALLEIPEIRRRLNGEALCQYLTYGFVMPPLTLFDGITKLAPGEMYVVGSDIAVSRSLYWTPASNPSEVARVRALPANDHAAAVRAMLVASVEARMVSDVPIGAFLSGGVDSSAVVAIMARASGRPVDTVTVANAGHPDLDEWTYAERVARAVGARIHRVDISEQDAMEVLPTLAWHMDEPVSDPAAMNTFFASRALRANGIKVALVGEGADEVFLGYSAFLKYQRLSALLRYRSHLPSIALRVGERVGRATLGALGASIHQDLLGRAFQGQPVFLGTEVFFQDSEKLGLLGGLVPNLYPASAVAAAVQESAPEALRADPLSLFGYSDMRMRMAEKLLMRVDKMSSAHSIEVRSPFLDRALADYAIALPASVRVAQGVTKHLLKEAVAPLIPQEVIHRRKQGFSTPIASWLCGNLGRYFQNRVGTSSIFAHGVLRRDAALDLLERHRTGGTAAKGTHTRLWNLMMLMEWYDRYQVDGLAASSLPAERAAA